MVGDEKSAKALQTEIKKLENSKKELQHEIEVISGVSSNQSTATKGNAASSIRAFGQMTRERNTEKSAKRKSTRPKRVK